MKKNVKQIANKVKVKARKNSPVIFVGLGLAGMITSTVLAVKATPKALDIIKHEEEKKGEKLDKKEVVKATWKCYIPTAITTAASIGCIVGGTKVSLSRTAAVSAAYEISRTAFDEYRNKVTKNIGHEAEQKIRDEIQQDKINKNPAPTIIEDSDINVTGYGNTLCYDSLSGRYFRCDSTKIKEVENKVNRRLMTDMYVSINELYNELGLDPINPLGNSLGWNVDRGLLDIEISSLVSNNGKPCLALDYSIEPYKLY